MDLTSRLRLAEIYTCMYVYVACMLVTVSKVFERNERTRSIRKCAGIYKGCTTFRLARGFALVILYFLD